MKKPSSIKNIITDHKLIIPIILVGALLRYWNLHDNPGSMIALNAGFFRPGNFPISTAFVKLTD